MRIQTNTSALKARNSYSKTNGELAKTLEKLSSGYCINRAADNAAGLGVSEKMRYMITGLDQGEMNVQDGVSYVQVAEGALFEIEDMLNRSKELSEQAMNGTYTEAERESINDEIQQIKEEIDRIINSTSFNGLNIWGTDNIQYIQTGTQTALAVEFKNNDYDDCGVVNNINKEFMPIERPIMTADKDNGIVISWKAINGNEYSTKNIPWPKPANASYSFNMGDYLPDDLMGKGIDYPISYETSKYASHDDVIQAINQSWVSHTVDFGWGLTITGSANKVHWTGMGLSTTAEIAAGKNMEAYDTEFIKPTNDVSNQVSQVDSLTKTGTWKYSFTMGRLGNMNAVVNASSVQAFVADVENAILNGQSYVGLSFSMVLENEYLIGGENYFTDNIVGGFGLKVDIEPGDTVESVIERINDITMFDMWSNSGSPQKGGTPSCLNFYASNTIDEPIMEASNYDVIIQGGLHDIDQIHIEYDVLSLEIMGMSTASALTVHDAERTFNAIEGALSMVVSQHGQFGAYTNRLEHAANANSNSNENLQAAVSRIRDTDMAKEFSKFTQKNILLQAAQSLLAQANQQPQQVLALLQ